MAIYILLYIWPKVKHYLPAKSMFLLLFFGNLPLAHLFKCP